MRRLLEDIQIQTNPSDYGREMVMTARFNTEQFAYLTKEMLVAGMKNAAEEIGKKIAEQMFPEVMSKIDANAVANMSIAEAGAEIHTLLQKKLPDRVDRIVERSTRTEVYKTGWFGGTKRVR